jgi:hypothetical protein
MGRQAYFVVVDATASVWLAATVTVRLLAALAVAEISAVAEVSEMTWRMAAP